MIYLIQDCYKDENNNYIDILKIGYSDKPFMESRNNQYKTHNYGYRFLGEREGDTKFEHYLHEKFKSFRLSNDSEWCIYNSSIISEFFTIDENEKNIILTKEQYISNIQFYLIQNLTKPEELYKRYKETIVDDLKKEFTIEDNELSCIYNRIKETFNRVYEITYKEIKENCNISNHFFDDVPNLIRDTWLDENPWKNQAELYYKTNTREKSQEEFNNYLEAKKRKTESLLNVYNNTTNLEDKHNLADNYQAIAKIQRYKKDFVAVNTHSGSDLKPVFNKLVMISEMRAFEIQQVDYADRFSVFSALDKQAEVENLNEYIDNFYKLDTQEKYMYICNLPESTALALLPHLPTSFQNYYTVLGPRRMRSLWYDVTKMRKEYEGIIGNQGVDIRSLIISGFEVGKVYPKSEVKKKLREIYDKYGYSKTARAVDLGDYFIIKNCMITNKETGKRDASYEILAIKE